MRASDVVVRVRNTFGDKDSAQIQDEDFIRWINDAQREVASKFEFNQIKGTHDLVAMENEYTLPGEAVKIYSVICNGTPLVWVSSQEGMDLAIDGVGVPTTYWVWNRVLTLWPRPNIGKSGGLIVYYIAQPNEVTAIDSALTVPAEYHSRVVDYCLAQAYLIDNDREGYNMITSKMLTDFPTFYNDRTGDSTDYYPTVITGDWDG